MPSLARPQVDCDAPTGAGRAGALPQEEAQAFAAAAVRELEHRRQRRYPPAQYRAEERNHRAIRELEGLVDALRRDRRLWPRRARTSHEERADASIA